MQGASWIFFIVFAGVLVITYLAIRREWASPVVVSAVSVLGSIIAMTLVSLAQGNSIIQAIIVGIVVGSVFSGATLAIAWYFHSNELRARYAAEQGYTPEDYPMQEYPQEDYPADEGGYEGEN